MNRREFTNSIVRVLVDTVLDQVVDNFAEDSDLDLKELESVEFQLSVFSEETRISLVNLLFNKKLKAGYRVAHVIVKLWGLEDEAHDYLWDKTTEPVDGKKLLPRPPNNQT